MIIEFETYRRIFVTEEQLEEGQNELSLLVAIGLY